MNKQDLKQLYELETKMKFLQTELRDARKDVEDIQIKFDLASAKVWTYINTMTNSLREGDKLNETRLN